MTHANGHDTPVHEAFSRSSPALPGARAASSWAGAGARPLTRKRGDHTASLRIEWTRPLFALVARPNHVLTTDPRRALATSGARALAGAVLRLLGVWYLTSSNTAAAGAIAAHHSLKSSFPSLFVSTGAMMSSTSFRSTFIPSLSMNAHTSSGVMNPHLSVSRSLNASWRCSSVARLASGIAEAMNCEETRIRRQCR